MTKRETIWRLRNELGAIKEHLASSRRQSVNAMKSIWKLTQRRKDIKSELRQLGGKPKELA